MTARDVWLTVAQAAVQVHCHPNTIRAHIRARRLPAMRDHLSRNGSRLLIRQADLKAWRESLLVPAVDEAPVVV